MPAFNTSKSSQNIINHIALVLDASVSMVRHQHTVPKVADTLIKELAEHSKLVDQETRVSVYTFSDYQYIDCLIYDKDVLRLPSIAGLYKIIGNTALCSATLRAIDDLAMTPEKYGDHSYLIDIITDGQENVSLAADLNKLPTVLRNLKENWTLAAFVPDAQGVHYAKKFGFPAGNITTWDTTSGSGFTEVGEVIRQSTYTYMDNRAHGVRGSRNLFNMTPANPKDIKKSLTPMTPGSYVIEPVKLDMRIDDFTKGVVGSYTPGRTYYEMTKRENIQGYKGIAILVEADKKLYVGDAARDLVGIPKGTDVRVGPGDHPGYKVFVQSTSMNRKLLGISEKYPHGTQALIMR